MVQVQVYTCVSLQCAQCGQALGSPEFEAHYPSEETALEAAVAAGWVEGPSGRWWCSCCGPVLECETEGHVFTEWQPLLSPINDEPTAVETAAREGDSPGPAEAAAGEQGDPVGRAYRYCRRCCLHESRSAWPGWVLGGVSRQGKSAGPLPPVSAAAAEGVTEGVA
jgi:hypothetical protein